MRNLNGVMLAASVAFALSCTAQAAKIDELPA